MEGICPNCGSEGPVGTRCGTAGCGVQELHRIPAEAETRRVSGPLGRDPLVGRVVGDHLVVGKIGSGGFGSVYVALQMPLFMKTALKMLKVEAGQGSSTEAHQVRFEKEAQALARLVHPNIVRLIKYGMFGGMPYIVMEYVGTGRDLARELADRKLGNRGFSLAEVRRIVTQVAHALEAAHNENVIHRDIKPGNIMLQPVEGNPLYVRVLDFGLAKMVADGSESTVAMGTPLYMAPEQYLGRDIGPWTDLYAAALVCFEMLTGRRAFSATNSQELYLQKISSTFSVTHEAGEAGVPPPVVQFMRKATAKEPSERFRNVPEFLAELNAMFDALERAGLRSLHTEAVGAAGEAGVVSAEVLVPGAAAEADAATLTSLPLEGREEYAEAEGTSTGAGSKRWIVPAVAAAVALGLLVSALLLWPSGASEIALSETREGDQVEPAVAVLADGRVLAAWRAVRSDGATSDVFARILDRYGKPISEEFRISSFDGTDVRVPALGAFGDGRVLAVWSGELQDGSGMGVIGQWLAPDLARYREEFVVNSDFRDGDQEGADIAVSPGGGFAVVWQSNGQDGDDFGIVCQVFASNGERKGKSLAVNTLTTGRQRFPSVAAGPQDRYLVVWESSQSAQEQEDYTIFGQLLDLEGNRIGDPAVVNSFAKGRQRYPDSTAVPGGYVVVWTSEEQDGSGRGVFGQILDSDGARVGEEFRVNSFTVGDQWIPRVAAFGDGRFVVVWNSAGQDGSGFGIFGQLFASDGIKKGPEFQVNEHTESDQVVRAVSVWGDGGLFVAWDSKGQDGAGWGVFARGMDIDAAVGK
ncbi:MAG: serine/threonine protein kinase [Deltaproteobacteria bacterium]|nr:serine/threonine protein kinase [Deltaproteobacteria bacterium]